MAKQKMMIGMALSMALGTGIAVAQAGGSGGAQQPSGGTPSGATSPNSPGGMNSQGQMNGMSGNGASMQDKMFLRKATQGSNFEIQTANLAMQKSSSDDVKQFAQMMIQDHTKLNDGMKPVASEAGVTPPTGISKKDKVVYKQLQGLSGDAFDKAYIQAMVKDHTEDLKQFKMEANNGQLASEKSAAEQGAQVVDMHLQKAQALAQAHNVSSGM